MPSETVYVDAETYEYVVTTKDDDQSVGQRIQELIETGLKHE